jgi:dimethylargininase
LTIKSALVRVPSNSFPSCISLHTLRDQISLKKARKQHQKYCEILFELGLEVINLSPEHTFPDACFIEDTAVIYSDRIFISQMGAQSRQGEEKSVLEYFSKKMKVKSAQPPATIEGGDVMHLDDLFIVGNTQRTNTSGISQLSDWFNVEIETITNPDIVHLKSYMTLVDRNTVILAQNYKDYPLFEIYDKIILPERELYSANSLTINDVVIIPSGFPHALQHIRERGYEVRTLEMSEFEKCEGALTCLSLLF